MLLDPRMREGDMIGGLVGWVENPPYERPRAIFHLLAVNRRSMMGFAQHGKWGCSGAKGSRTQALLAVLSVFAKRALGCMMAGFGGEGDVWSHSGRTDRI
jgi:hypothetical protein